MSGETSNQQSDGFKQNQPDQRPNQFLNQINQIKFTSEENNLLIECRNEAFWQRSVPLVVASTLALSLAMRRNIISNNHGFFKQIMVAGLAYSVGKVTYFEKCKEKIKARLSPDSNLYKIMVSGDRSNLNFEPLPNKLPTQQQQQQQQPQSQTSGPTTYDELRMRNRGIQPITKDKSTDLNQDDFLNLNSKQPTTSNSNQEIDFKNNIKQEQRDKRKYKVNQYGDAVYADD